MTDVKNGGITALTRKLQESIAIGDDVIVTVMAIDKGHNARVTFCIENLKSTKAPTQKKTTDGVNDEQQ